MKTIESAPKDGSRVMVWSPIWRGCWTFARWDDDKYAKKPHPQWSLENDFGKKTISRDNQPTHWMETPENPK